MQLLLVQVHVKPDRIEAFKTATMTNINGSLREPGVTQFELFQYSDDPSRFVLIEGYRSQDAVLAHKETPHYKIWKDSVADMMASPRNGTRLERVFPAD